MFRYLHTRHIRHLGVPSSYSGSHSGNHGGGHGGGKNPPKMMTQEADDVPYFHRNWKPIVAMAFVGASLELKHFSRLGGEENNDKKVDTRKLEEKIKDIAIFLGMYTITYLSFAKVRSIYYR